MASRSTRCGGRSRADAGGELRARCELVDLAAVARRLGVRRWEGEPAADRLLVHLLARRPPPNQYATSAQTRRWAVLLRTRLALRAASVALAVGACLSGGAAVLDGATASSLARSLALHATFYERRYGEALAALPSAPAEPATLERVVSAARTLDRRRADPVDLLALVSDALANFPRVRIESLSWQASDDPEVSMGTGHGDRAGPSPSGAAPKRDPVVLFQVARVSARIEPFDGDYRAAIDTVRRFAGALAVHSGVEHVRILSLPLELGSEHALAGDAGTTSEEAAFEIRVALRGAGPGAAEA